SWKSSESWIKFFGKNGREAGGVWLEISIYPHCFVKCAQRVERKGVIAILEETVCAKCAQAIENAGAGRAGVEKEGRTTEGRDTSCEQITKNCSIEKLACQVL